MEPLEQWLDRELQQAIQPLVPLPRQITKLWKTAQMAQAVGDLATLSNALSQLKRVWEQIPSTLEGALTVAASYDLKAYLLDRFDADFRNACAASDLAVEGQFPRYLIYPLRLQVDARRMGVLINRKLHKGLRISSVIEVIRTERDRLLARPFNTRNFLADLEATYDDLVEMESAKNKVRMSGHEMGLRHIYRRLVPMRQWRTDYPEVFFVFDLHRLLKSGEIHAPDGRRVHLAPAREARTNLSVLDPSGREVQFGLIAFRKD
ncbi:MAG: hypothetical protein Q7T26_11255 [Dehalococcoidia bacterium]|nr:hypothetical protein [Dehalococcoidia bacterium]